AHGPPQESDGRSGRPRSPHEGVRGIRRNHRRDAQGVEGNVVPSAGPRRLKTVRPFAAKAAQPPLAGWPAEDELSGPLEAKLRLVVQGGQCGGVLGTFEIDDLQDLVFSE